MIKIYPYSNLGFANYGWLKAKYHFSFANYYNPFRTNFGELCVINDDIVEPKKGFPMHSHQNMEIITYVRAGEITHQDNLKNIGKIYAGDVQVMSAGSGIVHSEYNLGNEITNLYQIWIHPNKQNIKPRWETKKIDNVENKFNLIASGVKDAPLFIHQDVSIYVGKFQKNSEFEQKIQENAYILASSGSFLINENLMEKGDGCEVINKNLIHIKAKTDCEILIIELENLMHK